MRSAGFPVAFSGCRLGTIAVRLRLWAMLLPSGVVVRLTTEDRRDCCHGDIILECMSGPRLKASASQLADHSMLREASLALVVLLGALLDWLRS